jgi:putative nucleotidyltransferase with HDIG domain
MPVSALAVAIAQDLGMSADEIQGLKIAGIVHDIGKIRVPVEILAKPGRLDDVEMALIRLHPEAGYQILKNIHFPWPIAKIVQQHHERENGQGYPLGLKHGEILITAAIVAVADVVDAMSTHRPYRAALGLEPAINALKKGRGLVYDPVVVDACLRVLDRQEWTPNL